MNLSKVIPKLLLAFMSFSLLLLPTASMATPILGGQLFVQTTGDVQAKYLGGDAGGQSFLYLDSPANSLGLIFDNKSTPVGTVVDLGSFAAGTELVFRLHVTFSGYDYFTGPGSRNPDGIAHAVVATGYVQNMSSVGFEDLYGGGDKDYNDLMFAFTNTAPNVVPLPPAFFLVGSGMGVMVLIRRLHSKAAG
jgi:hypothetical protein